IARGVTTYRRRPGARPGGTRRLPRGFSHRADDRGGVRGAEDGGARHEGVGSRRREWPHVLDLDAAVHGNLDGSSPDELAQGTELRVRGIDEPLAPEAGV